jgi:hypothetical protein
MVPGLSLNFSILPKELLTFMVYIGVDIMASNEIYDAGVKIGAIASVPH